MIKGFKKILAAAMAGVYIFTSGLGYSGNTIISYAAEAATIKSLENVFPAGVTLYSDSFPGLNVTFDGKTSFKVDKYNNIVTLQITVINDELAKKSACALSTIFGKIDIPMEVGRTTIVAKKVKGVDTKTYEDMVLKTGNMSLFNMLKAMFSGDAANAVENYTRFLMQMAEVAQTMYDNEQHIAGLRDWEEKQRQAVAESPVSYDDHDDDDPAEPYIEPYDRLILIYLDGTNLEEESADGTKNILDLLRGHIPSNVKVMMLTGGTRKWYMADREKYREYTANYLYDSSWANLKEDQKKEAQKLADEFYSLYKTEISGVKMWEVVQDGAYNKLKLLDNYDGHYMTDPDFFAQIVDRAALEVPANMYDLIIWDHGSAFNGYGGDDLLADYKKKNPGAVDLPDTGLSLKQMAEALEKTAFIGGGGKFDFIGFDACLMANYEVVSKMSHLASYYIGSEELEPGEGWDYYAMMEALGANPTIDTTDLGREIVSSFVKQYMDRTDITLSMLDLSKVEDLNYALSGFARELIKEADERELYYEIIRAVGTKSHFGTTNGIDNDNILDLKRLITALSSENIFSEDLIKAGKNVLSMLDRVVLANQYSSDVTPTGGLSIYFPLTAYYSTDLGNDKEYRTEKASKTLKIYDENDLNSNYKEAVAKLAIRDLAGRILGQSYWPNRSVDSSELIEYINSVDDWKVIIDYSGANLQDNEDPVIKTIEKLIEDRITSQKINISLPEDEYGDPLEQGSYTSETTANVAIRDSQYSLLGDRVRVKVSMDLGDENVSLGNTVLYSTDKDYDIQDDTINYTLNPYDKLWYLLNNQITSLYITDYAEDGRSYSGYIPVCYWVDARSASNLDQGNMSRTDYLVDAAKNNKVTTVYLNVEATLNDNNEYVYRVNSYNTLKDGAVGSSSQISDLSDTYIELLGGMDDYYSLTDTPTVYSLGTAYIDEDANVSVTCYYIDNDNSGTLNFDYYLTDYYDNKYIMNADNMGQDRTNLDTFTMDIPAGSQQSTTTWGDSQTEAQKVRQEAGQYSQQQNEPVSTDSVRTDAVKSKQAENVAVDKVAPPADATAEAPAAEAAPETSAPEVASEAQESPEGEAVAEAPASPEAAAENAEAAAPETVAQEEQQAIAPENAGFTEPEAAPENDEAAAPETVAQEGQQAITPENAGFTEPEAAAENAEAAVPEGMAEPAADNSSVQEAAQSANESAAPASEPSPEPEAPSESEESSDPEPALPEESATPTDAGAEEAA